jgi:hypothetical protein
VVGQQGYWVAPREVWGVRDAPVGLFSGHWADPYEFLIIMGNSAMG